MDENPERRRQRAFRLLREMPHNTPKTESFRILDEAGCLDDDGYKIRKYESLIGAYHGICKRTKDVQMDMIPLWKFEENPDGTMTKVHYLGKFGEMDADQHYQHLDGRRTGIFDDTRKLYYYLRRIKEDLRLAVERRLEFDGMPPEPRGPDPDDDGDE